MTPSLFLLRFENIPPPPQYTEKRKAPAEADAEKQYGFEVRTRSGIEQPECRANMGVGGRATPRSVAEKSAGFVKPGRVAAEMTERMQAIARTVGIMTYNPNGFLRFGVFFASSPSFLAKSHRRACLGAASWTAQARRLDGKRQKSALNTPPPGTLRPSPPQVPPRMSKDEQG